MHSAEDSRLAGYAFESLSVYIFDGCLDFTQNVKKKNTDFTKRLIVGRKKLLAISKTSFHFVASLSNVKSVSVFYIE